MSNQTVQIKVNAYDVLKISKSLKDLEEALQ